LLSECEHARNDGDLLLACEFGVAVAQVRAVSALRALALVRLDHRGRLGIDLRCQMICSIFDTSTFIQSF
jgi:hypothetical protein